MDPKIFREQLEQLADVYYDEEIGGLRIKRLKPRTWDCTRCQKTVDSTLCEMRRVERLLDHWRHHCKACRSYLHPITLEPLPGPLTSTANQVISILRQHRRDLEPVAKKYRRTKKEMEELRRQQTQSEKIESETEIIIRYD